MKAADMAKLAQAADMAALAQKISHDVKEYLVVAEQEQTKRSAINAACATELAKIDAVRSTFEAFLDRSFEERRRSFEELFSLVRQAMERNDLKTLELSLSAAVELARISPLAEAKSLESLRSAMDDPDHEFVI